MEGHDKVQKLLNNGKISPDQAEQLTDALKHSNERSKRIVAEVALQKEKRMSKAFGMLGKGSMGILFIVGILILLAAGSSGLGRDTKKALDTMQQASAVLVSENYKEALTYYKKAIKKAPRLAPAQAQLGLTYALLYEQDKDVEYQKRAKEAFVKSMALADRKGGSQMTTTGLVFLIMFLLLIFAGTNAFLLSLYNSLVNKEETANEAWAQILAAIQRKLDLVPSLMQAVQEYAHHEKETLEETLQSRGRLEKGLSESEDLLASEKDQLKEINEGAQNLDLNLKKISALAEQYPDLKANVNYLTIQTQLEETENWITGERQRFNQKAKEYNASLRLFPFNLMAALFKFAPKEYFKIEG